MYDKKAFSILEKEKARQDNCVELIASENFASEEVRKMTGSIFTNKYAEGYPGARYYGGCENVDQIESLAIERAKKMFGAKFANVQPHSGTQANFAAYFSVLKANDRILGMSLDSGGHLTHGFHVSLSGQLFQAKQYRVNKKTQEIDYDEVLKIAKEWKPKLIICGASAYPRVIDFGKFRKIADEVGAFLLADVAHIAGLIVADLHPNPLDYGVDIVTTTTQKSLRGPRGGLILTNNEELAKKIDKSVFPGSQGGPLMNTIAAKAVAFYEALQPEFIEYQEQVIKNAEAIAFTFINAKAKVTTNGTDNHLVIVNVKKSFNITGKRAEELLEKANITVNKNAIPYDELPPSTSSGIRIGTPAMTTKGWTEDKFIPLTKIIISILENNDESYAKKRRGDVLDLLNG